MVALRRCAVSLQQNGLAVLQQRRISAGGAEKSAAPAPGALDLLHRPAGILIAILRVAAPDQLRLRARLGWVDLKSTQQPGDARLILHQREILAELNPREALFRLENFNRLAFERRLDRHDPVPVRSALRPAECASAAAGLRLCTLPRRPATTPPPLSEIRGTDADTRTAGARA